MAEKGEKFEAIPLWVVSSKTEQKNGPYRYRSQAENALAYAPGTAKIVKALKWETAFKQRPIR